MHTFYYINIILQKTTRPSKLLEHLYHAEYTLVVFVAAFGMPFAVLAVLTLLAVLRLLALLALFPLLFRKNLKKCHK